MSSKDLLKLPDISPAEIIESSSAGTHPFIASARLVPFLIAFNHVKRTIASVVFFFFPSSVENLYNSPSAKDTGTPLPK